MLTDDDKAYLEKLHELHAERFENRLCSVEREMVEYRKTALTSEQSEALVEEARKIFRAESLRINTWTRVSVAIVAALAVIGNGTANVIVDHTESKAMARYQFITDQKLAGYEARVAMNNRQLADDVKAAITDRNSHLEFIVKEALIVKAGNP